jgi:hypothetical protein
MTDALLEADSILCRLCGKRFRAISNTHLVGVHGFSPDHPIDEYKQAFQLERAECEETRQCQVRSLEETWERQGRLWTPERVLAAITDRATQGAPLNSSSVRTAWPQLIVAAGKLFGSWDGALESAGVDTGEVRVRTAWTREKIIAALLRLRAAGTLSHQQGSALGQAARRAFGSWTQALRAAGLLEPIDQPAALKA